MRSFLLISNRKKGFIPSSSPSELTAGTITEGNHTSTVINATASSPTGGTSPYTYQWYNAADDTAISGQTTLTLSWTGRTAGTQYGYYLIATDDNSDTVQYSTVQSTTETTLVAGSITEGTHTEDTINATASAPTGGDSPYTYQWYNDADDSAISGQTTLTLAWTSRAAGTQYSYYLIATDSDGQTVQYTTQTSTTDTSNNVVAGFVGLGTAAGSYDETDTHMLVWNQTASGTTVPALSGGMTFIWWCRPTAAQVGYWSGLFHAAYDFDIWGGGAQDSSDLRYMGMHPYPSSGATVNKWSISANGADNQTYENEAGEAVISQWQRKYVQVGICTPNGGAVDYVYYPDYVSAASPGNYLTFDGDTKTDPSAANRGIIQFDAPWNRGNERFYGPLSMPDIYTRALSLAEVDLALADPFDPAVVADLWFTNRYPTSNTDISDKSGNGNDPVWVIGSGTSIPALYQES